jgi:hypothetical protein
MKEHLWLVGCILEVALRSHHGLLLLCLRANT